jgi:hypothetical protein
MDTRRYYSTRNPAADSTKRLTFAQALELFYAVFHSLDEDHYFEESFGRGCTSVGSSPPTLTSDVTNYLFHKLRKDRLWPIGTNYKHYSEADLFDIIEFLFDAASLPTKTQVCRFHSFHGYVFDREKGRERFRQEINDIFRDYDTGFELSQKGEVFSLPSAGLQPLIQQDAPPGTPEEVKKKILLATEKFLKRRATLDDQREAVRLLVDALEFMRPKAKELLASSDESDLFNIANNFAIRHHNQNQKPNYDEDVWLPWMFYFYLSSVHALLRLIQKNP